MYLKESFEPWTPTPDSRMLRSALTRRVLRAYDRPLAGFFEQPGKTIAFYCIEGHVERWSLWAYAEVDAAEIETLASLPYDQFVERLATRTGAVALASDDDGIRAETRVQALGQARTVLDDLLRRLQESEIASARRSLRLAS